MHGEILQEHASTLASSAAAPVETPSKEKRWQRGLYLVVIAVIWILFLELNLRHLFEPFRDYGKPLAGEPFYAIRALNYLRHGYFTHWLGVSNNLNPHPEALKFKFTEMPAYFVASSLAFKWFGVSAATFRVVELLYALGVFVAFSLGTRRLYGSKTSLLASLVFLLLPINSFLLYIAWSFLFSLLGILSYAVWLKERGRTAYGLTIAAALLGCLHHVAGFFFAPALLVHAAMTGSLRKNAKALVGVFLAFGILGLVYLGQIFLLRQNLATVGTKAISESLFNLGYLHNFFVLNIGKLAANLHELLKVPVLILCVFWLGKKMTAKEELSAGDHFTVLLLVFPFLFFTVFIGMVASHLHFLALFAPFAALACVRALLEMRRRTIAYGIITALILYLAVTDYGIQKKYDAMFWSSGNARGYALAEVLRERTGEAEAVAGIPVFGYSYRTLPPAFFFYLQRDYFGDITTLDEFLEAMKSGRIRFFLFPVSAQEAPESRTLGEYLSRRYPHFVEPHRKEILIFDLHASPAA